MFSHNLVDFGRRPNIIRDLSAFAGKRKQEIGAENVYDFTIGSPNVPVPEVIHDTMKELLQTTDPVALHSYTDARGSQELRETIANYVNRRFGDHLEPGGIYVTAGASSALAIVLRGLTVPGNEVIVFTPHYMEYLVYIEAAGAKVVVAESLEDTFQIDMEKFEAALTEQTRIVIVNSPNNPSGVVYTDECLKAMTALLKRKEEEYGHPIFLLADEPYRELAYDVEVPYLMNYYDDTIVSYSYSKTRSLPGERMGYLAVCKRCAMYDEVVNVISGSGRALGYICASNLYQRMLTRCIDVVSDVSYYKRNRDLLVSGLESVGFSCVRPDGAFYLFVKSPTQDSMEACEKAKEFDIIVVPGHDFGVPNYLRVSYCVQYETIERSMPAWKKLAEYYGLG